MPKKYEQEKIGEQAHVRVVRLADQFRAVGDVVDVVALTVVELFNHHRDIMRFGQGAYAIKEMFRRGLASSLKSSEATGGKQTGLNEKATARDGSIGCS